VSGDSGGGEVVMVVVVIVVVATTNSAVKSAVHQSRHHAHINHPSRIITLLGEAQAFFLLFGLGVEHTEDLLHHHLRLAAVNVHDAVVPEVNRM
jgi:hypothetical protein